MQVIPAALEKNSSNLLSQIKRLSPYFHHFQIDIQDGRFVSNRTVQIDEIFRVVNQWNDESMNGLNFDFHLMVKDYQGEIEKLKQLRNSLKIQNIFLHFSLHPNYQLLISNYPEFIFGIVLNPEDTVEQLTKSYNLQTIPFIQIMSINPGPQGTQFMPETLKKVEQLRQYNYRSHIYLDGGINERTIPIIKSQKNQPDFLCIGSYLTKSVDLKKSVQYLKKTLQS